MVLENFPTSQRHLKESMSPICFKFRTPGCSLNISSIRQKTREGGEAERSFRVLQKSVFPITTCLVRQGSTAGCEVRGRGGSDLDSRGQGGWEGDMGWGGGELGGPGSLGQGTW